MPRKPKVKREKWSLQQWRAHNYATQFDKRAYVQGLPDVQRKLYARVAEVLPCPKLNIFGVGEWSREQEQLIFRVNAEHNLDVWYLNPWYCTETGWDDFQEQWKALPEPAPQEWVDWEKVIHKHMCTTSKVVHTQEGD